jgi:hypothetical protein
MQLKGNGSKNTTTNRTGAAMNDWKWEVDLDSLIGRHAHIETKDGTHRQGRITAITTKIFKLDGVALEIPHSVELNGDPVDLISLAKMRNLDIVRIGEKSEDG